MTTGQSSHFRGVLRRLGRTVKTSFAVVGVVAAFGLYQEFKAIEISNLSSRSSDSDESEEGKKNKKKKVLVIPFNRLQLVERKTKDLRGWLPRSLDTDSEDPIVEMEVRELVDLIHEASSDPDIVGMYGLFGHGSSLSQAGWADLEEIRNALRVFKESHRRHPEPNLNHQMQVIPRIESKPLYAYADTFVSLMDPANKEYYLASMFTHIHMQQNGELNLLGLTTQQFFLRDLLEKYGITLHVFKHGQYKNAPDMFTESRFHRAHRENVTNILEGINTSVCNDIARARSKALLTTWLKKNPNTADLWKRIHQAGTFAAVTAWKAGLIDYLPRRDPLPDLIDSNATETSKDEVKALWNHQETDFERFKAQETVSLKEYSKQHAKKKRAEEKKQKWRSYATKHPYLEPLLSTFGIDKEKDEGSDASKQQSQKHRESIALLYVTGAIGDAAARKLTQSIRKIRKDEDTKALILRVTSPGGSIFACETISQELQALKIPVVVSFGNVAASGGYYVAAHADRIFCSQKTITGSIGVFGVRADLTGLASQYGIKVQHVSAGDLGPIYNPFHPMTRTMKQHFASSIDRYYDQFKNVVSQGRALSLTRVEALAQGRVWTGDQAKSNGLVDELGGLYRAISYVQRSFTSTGEANIVVWPKQQSLLAKLLEAKGMEDAMGLLGLLVLAYVGLDYLVAPTHSATPTRVGAEALARDLLQQFQSGNGDSSGLWSGVVLAADENTAIECLLRDHVSQHQHRELPLLHDSFWQ